MTIDNNATADQASSTWNKAQRFGACLILILACTLQSFVAFAQNSDPDPDPDVEKGTYFSVTLDRSVVAVGDPITGTATIHEGDGDVDSDDNVTVNFSGGSQAAIATANGKFATPAASSRSSQSGNGTVNFSFTTSFPGGFTIDGTTPDAPDKSVIAHALGGPITGDSDVKYYCDYPAETPPLSASEVGHLNSASGQPSGTTYQWSISGPSTVTNGQTASSATFRSTGGGQATATVKYSLNGIQVTSPEFSISTHMPKVGNAIASGPPKDHIYYLNDPNQNAPYYGFDNQKIVYTVVDQDGKIMSGVPVEEVWRLLGYDPLANNNWPIPEMTAYTTDANGTFPDFFSTSNYSLDPRPGDPTFLKRPAFEPIATLAHWWYAGPSKPNTSKGCQLVHYPKVTYSTNGVTGD